jgi:hypothetical protein
MLYLSTGALRQTTRNFTDTAYRFSNWCQRLRHVHNFRQQQLPSPLWLLQLRESSLRVPLGCRFPQEDSDFYCTSVTSDIFHGE